MFLSLFRTGILKKKFVFKRNMLCLFRNLKQISNKHNITSLVIKMITLSHNRIPTVQLQCNKKGSKIKVGSLNHVAGGDIAKKNS